ncbi:hypothetical protein PSJ60_23835 [Escherichia coli]|nr:hypothetical protein [Escherichia coli]MDC9067838.1 hypothetical protein [Escherichia coli]
MMRFLWKAWSRSTIRIATKGDPGNHDVSERGSQMNKASPVELRVSIEMAHNRLHDTAIKCAGTQQLRERISRVLGEVITPDRHKQAEKSGPKGVILRRH